MADDLAICPSCGGHFYPVRGNHRSKYCSIPCKNRANCYKHRHGTLEGFQVKVLGVSPVGVSTLPPGADGTPPAELPVGGKGVDRGASVIVAKTPQTVVFDVKLSSGRKISAELEAESTEHQAQALLYDGAKPVCHILFFNQYQTRSYIFPIVRCALNGLMSKVGHGSRYRANRAAKAVAGASRPGESEVA